jgi:hypothetical protein
MDVESISNIPLSTQRQRDFWAWHYEKRGVFSVWSAYRMLVWNRDNYCAYYEGRPCTSGVKATENEWTRLWQVKVLSKLRVFLWRLARCSLPSGDVLHHRNMAPSDVCSICGAKDSWKHSLIECNMSKCVCSLEKEDIIDFIGPLQEEDARAWLAKVLSSLPMRRGCELW